MKKTLPLLNLFSVVLVIAFVWWPICLYSGWTAVAVIGIGKPIH